MNSPNPLLDLFKLHQITAQFQPPSNHRSNFAERAIRTYKSHFISILAGLHSSFPSDLWDLLLHISIITINHLRPSKLNPKLSAYAGIHCNNLDFTAHPTHPPGQLVVVHERPDGRPT